MHDQQTCSRSFAQFLLRPALIFSFASVGLSLSLILSHNLISTLNRPLHAPHCPSLKPWLFPSPDRRAYVLLNPKPKQESPDIVSSESLWNFSLKGYRSQTELLYLIDSGGWNVVLLQPDWLLCLARFVSWEGISRTRLEICPNPARCEADSNQWANIRNVISVPLSQKKFSVVCITLPSRTWIHHNTLGVENDYLTDHLKSLRQIPVNFSILW